MESPGYGDADVIEVLRGDAVDVFRSVTDAPGVRREMFRRMSKARERFMRGI
jgi:hypothetical protein